MQRSQRYDEAQQVANFLVQLKHKTFPKGHFSLDDDIDTRVPLREVEESQVTNGKLPMSYPMSPGYGRFDETSLERPPSLLEEPSLSDFSWEALLDNSKLVLMKDRDLVPDALFVAMAQMKACKLTQADRVGCYKSRELGFLGMACKHCGGQPGFGRYYPNSVRSLAQTTTSQTILKHIGGKCRFCPPAVRQAVLELQREQAIKEANSNGRPRYGSRKIFFQRMWARLHGTDDSQDESESEDSKIGEYSSSENHGTNSAESTDQESDAESREDRTTKNTKRKNTSVVRENKRLCIGM